jgi:glycosyltransferase involved in cell wall biosynthesis
LILYLTFNDPPSGIYSSQVIDVVKFLRADLNAHIRLVAFVSLRSFLKDRSRIRSELRDSLVLPMFPGVRNWKRNGILLGLVRAMNKPNVIIGRSVLATQLALAQQKKGWKGKVVYDGRGAIAAEWKEYGVIKDPGMLSEINGLEKSAVLHSDFRIAVSEQLLLHWKEQFSYSGARHVVIPCTLNKIYEAIQFLPSEITATRERLGFSAEDNLFVYSGSVAGWQSMSLLRDCMAPLLSTDSKARLLILSDPNENIHQLQNEFPGKVKCLKVAASEVPEYLVSADYGLLIREKSVTNKVASPVKFAEYLACGLPVIISEQLGDYTAFVERSQCGFLSSRIPAGKPDQSTREKMKNISLRNFTKSSYLKEYGQVAGLA